MVLFKAKFSFQRRVKLAQTLWLLSWLSVLVGCLTFGMGIFLKVQLWIHNEVMDNTTAHAVPNTVITAGLVGILLAIFAGKISQASMDLTKYQRWKSFMMPFFFLAILSCFVCLAALVLSVALRGTLEESLKIGLRNAIRFYKDTDTPGRCYQKRSMDKLQMDFQCCGNNHPKDWFEVQWISNRYLDFSSKEVKDRIKSNVDGRYLMDGVPFSCCNPSSPRPCIQMQITNNSAHYSYNFQGDELNIWVRGCREALLGYYTGIMATNGAAVTLSFLLQASVLVSLRYVQTSMDKIRDPDDVEADTEGFLLEKGVMETVNSSLEKIKDLFKSNQVETAEGGGEGAAGS
uniref:RDS/peripherin-like protein xRDS35 n=1 Tax=Xenopus laevis TaxID=8355 RepID=Q640Y1_XENLA|nr:Unknown (protein for MGC:84273) [Xenopus laevis]